MPGYHIAFPEGTATRMAELIKEEKVASSLKRMQCIYLRAKFNYPASAIAEIVGFHKQAVLNIHSAYLRYGEDSLKSKPKGGRLRENMTLQDETAFLKDIEQEGTDGQILEISLIKNKLEKKLGKKIAKSSVYELLHRHGWRKIAPRPYHPNRNIGKQEDFKKTSLPLSNPQKRWQKAKNFH